MAKSDVSLDLKFVSLSKASEYVSTGFPQLDALLAGKGLPIGKVVEIYGQPDSGKSLLAYYVLSNAQRQYPKRRVAIVDTEYRLDKEWLEKQGVNLDQCDVIQTIVAEEAFNAILEMLRSGIYSVVLLDSLGNMDSAKASQGTRFEYDKATKSYKSDQPGKFAMIVTQASKQIVDAAAKGDTMFLAVNQLRDAIGSFMTNIENTPGGRNWKYNRTVAIRLQSQGYIKSGNDVEGLQVRAEVRRSKISTPMVATDKDDPLVFFFDGGLDKLDVVNTYNKAIGKGVIIRAGMWYRWDTLDRKWKGKDAIMESLRNEEGLLEQLKKETEGFVLETNPEELEGSEDD